MPSKTITAYLAALGRKGGSVKSEKKAAAARLNAIGHGRPRKLDNEIKPASLLRRQKRDAMKEKNNELD